MRIRFIALIISIWTLLFGFDQLHSGKTDANGGHYDKSTGEYHYHHGYSAHSHYDMDGDGIIDCPYNFDDKTNHNYDSNSTSSKPADSTNKKAKRKITFWEIIVIIFYVIVAFLSGGFLIAFFLGMGLVELMTKISVKIFKKDLSNTAFIITWIIAAVIVIAIILIIELFSLEIL